jgi:cytochrome c556
MDLLRFSRLVLLACLLMSASYAADAPGPIAVTSVNEMMIKIVQPGSDAVFYISRNPPANDAEWDQLEARILILAESANLLMLPGYARDQGQWLHEAKLFRDVATTAWNAAKAKNLNALEELNNDLYSSCESCHEAYR